MFKNPEIQHPFVTKDNKLIKEDKKHMKMTNKMAGKEGNQNKSIDVDK